MERFGAKVSLSKAGRFAYVDRLSRDAHNESADLKPVIETYRQRYGRYPQNVCVDAIFRIPQYRHYCSERGFRIGGPTLGRRALNPTEEEKHEAAADERNSTEIEGVLGRGKRRSSLATVTVERADTSGTAIAIAFLVMNLETLLHILSRLFADLCRRAVLPRWFPLAGPQTASPVVA